MELIKNLDYLYHNISLTFNKKGETGFKTFIGGIISLTSIIISIIFCIYFIFRIFSRKDLSVIYSNQINPFINLTYSNKLPFLLRLTDSNSLPFEEQDKLYYITASIWYGGSNDTSLSTSSKQYSQSLKIDKCNLDIHFDEEYKNYFKDFKDLETYYCIEPRNYSQTIFGLYGNTFPFSYYSFTVRYCSNNTENNNSCYSIDDIKTQLSVPFLDIIFIDYTIDSLKQSNVKNIYIRKERFELSVQIFKRIWLYLENVKYIIDNGFIFSNNKIENFHMYETVRSDVNIFEDSNVVVTLTVLNGIKNSIYNKEYTKLQNYISIIGGIIKVINICSSFFNYFNAKNSYYLKLIKDYVIENNDRISLNENANITKNNILTSILNKSKNQLQINNINKMQKNDSRLFMNLPVKNSTNESKYKLFRQSSSLKILPSIFINKNERILFKKYKEYINNQLNIMNILKKLDVIQINEDEKKNSTIAQIKEEIKINNFIMDNRFK